MFDCFSIHFHCHCILTSFIFGVIYVDIHKYTCMLVHAASGDLLPLVGLFSDNPGFVCLDLELWTEGVDPTAEDLAYFESQAYQ